MNIIRKISVGSGYPDNCIHYQVDKPIRMGAVPANISKIKAIELPDGSINYDVYVSFDTDKSTVLWKTIVGVPVIVEYLVDFE